MSYSPIHLIIVGNKKNRVPEKARSNANNHNVYRQFTENLDTHVNKHWGNYTPHLKGRSDISLKAARQLLCIIIVQQLVLFKCENIRVCNKLFNLETNVNMFHLIVILCLQMHPVKSGSESSWLQLVRPSLLSWRWKLFNHFHNFKIK